MKKKNAAPIIPTWFLDNEEEEKEVKVEPVVQAAAQHVVNDEAANEDKKIEQQKIHQQTMLLQKRAAKIICGMAPKRARGAVRIKRR